MKRLLDAAKLSAFCVGAILLLGLGIGTSPTMPSYARVYADDGAKTYLALPCLAEWKERKSDQFAFLRLSTAGEVWKLNYKPDAICSESGDFSGPDRSITGVLFEKVGILPPRVPWWDKPYRDELATLYAPNRNHP
jgi:hypothetical protein